MACSTLEVFVGDKMNNPQKPVQEPIMASISDYAFEIHLGRRFADIAERRHHCGHHDTFSP
jgi:hypothetical protein